ncbi:putative secreted protein [Saccharothrix espanaensis DSM 44229]|uniref:Putative secreted protein n=1 Tax=Saccharothrix espanaensis (strain ATCC 51144 / DSM 44229 / JCM 9112 / NBRC 15066 / NRRL 15764) TaxID=1179773 RepID=K0K881_SACES|nr:putative secreted protein [Saccharothrix espanaensis DSM 44229]
MDCDERTRRVTRLMIAAAVCLVLTTGSAALLLGTMNVLGAGVLSSAALGVAALRRKLVPRRRRPPA